MSGVVLGLKRQRKQLMMDSLSALGKDCPPYIIKEIIIKSLVKSKSYLDSLLPYSLELEIYTLGQGQHRLLFALAVASKEGGL